MRTHRISHMPTSSVSGVSVALFHPFVVGGTPPMSNCYGNESEMLFMQQEREIARVTVNVSSAEACWQQHNIDWAKWCLNHPARLF